MPSVLICQELNYLQAESELKSFKDWIADNPRFGERAVVRELKRCPNLCLLMSFLGTRGKPDRFKHEFEIDGVFRADLVVGSSRTRHFTFVEFEGGEDNSLFGPGSTNQMRNWGRKSSMHWGKSLIGHGP